MRITQLNKQKGFYISDFSKNVVWAIGLILSVVLAILFAMTLFNDVRERRIESNLSGHTSTLLEQLTINFNTMTKEVKQSIDNNIHLKGDDLIEAIGSDLPNNLRVMISEKPIFEIKPVAFPDINYATLDMLKKTKKSNADPIPEIHLFGRVDQYINFIHILDTYNDKYLIISLPANVMFQNINPPTLENGNIEIMQSAGRFSVVNLRTWGKSAKSSSVVTQTQVIPNSYFNIKYSFESPFYLLKGMTTLSTIIGLLSSVLLFLAIAVSIFKQIMLMKKQQEEKKAYVHLGDSDGPATIEETINQHNKSVSEEKMKKEIKLDKTIFRAYDIRGIVDESLTVSAVTLIGQAIGTENIRRGKRDIVVARDGRLSGKTLLKALIEGLKKSGCNVINIGAVPTGVLYFATHHLGTGSGVMLTGSHNPSNYNGLKIMLNGETLAGKLIMALYKAIMNHELDKGEGTEQEMDIVDDYVDYISSDIQLENELKVVVDAGNGIGGIVGPQVLEEIGCEVIPLHCEIDGNFPNHHPDPSVPKNLNDLIAAVKATNADLGIAFDGDADRLGVVTKEGEIIYPDRILMLYAKDVLTRQPGASIIFDVKCTGHLPKVIVENGGLPIIWKTGHSFMKAKIIETKAALAGEMSGHFFFNERWFGFDDGIYAAARLLEILDVEDRPAKEIFDELPNSVSTPELKCHTEEGENYAFMEKFQKAAQFPEANLTTIDGIRADFADGWGLVRCSNTTPCLVMRFDADTKEALERIQEEFKKQILAIDDSLELPF